MKEIVHDNYNKITEKLLLLLKSLEIEYKMYKRKEVYTNPNINTATITVSYEWLNKFLKHQGNKIKLVKI